MATDSILVTGAAGFIASRVCQLLLDQQQAVVGLDNLNDYYDPKLKQLRLRDLNNNPNFLFREIDIEDRAAVAKLFQSRASVPPFSAILHLAARAGVRPSVENPWQYLRTNTEGTLNLLDLCREYQIPKLVLASTSSVYGAGAKVPFDERAPTDMPASPYAASKKAAELLAYSYHYLHGLDISAVRYFTVYGPAGRPDMAILRFIKRIDESQPIEVFGDGHQQRDFSYVDDIARGTIAALKPVGFETFNLGNDRPVELLEVIRQIGSLLQKEPQIIFGKAHQADVPITWASIEKAKSRLDWAPQVGLEEGLRRTIRWYRAHAAELNQMNFS